MEMPNRRRLAALFQVTRFLTALSLVAAFPSVSYAQTPIETEFATQQAHYRRLAGATGEPSCGGTGLTVHLDGKAIRKLAYSIETSRRLIQRDYYLRDGQPKLVVETTYFLLDQQAERLARPRLEAVTRYSFAEPATIPADKKKEFQEHTRYLLNYFRDHRNEFKPEHD